MSEEYTVFGSILKEKLHQKKNSFIGNKTQVTDNVKHLSYVRGFGIYSNDHVFLCLVKFGYLRIYTTKYLALWHNFNQKICFFANCHCCLKQNVKNQQLGGQLWSVNSLKLFFPY